MNKITEKVGRTFIYLTPKDYSDHIKEIEAASEYIYKRCKNLNSLDFNDLSAEFIQIGGTHKQNPNYIILSVRLKSDWSNLDFCIKEFISKWNDISDSDISDFNKFIEEGEKYGWD